MISDISTCEEGKINYVSVLDLNRLPSCVPPLFTTPSMAEFHPM